MTNKIQNLIIRAITGVAFVVVMVGCILYNHLSTTALFGVITALTLWEYASVMNHRDDVDVSHVGVVMQGLILYLSLNSVVFWIIPFSFFLLLSMYMMIRELYLKKEHAMNNWAYALAAQLYITLPLSLFPFIQDMYTELQWMPLAIFVFIWASDTGAYCTGSLIGRRKLFPRISPNKSWEGSIGGAVIATLASVVFYKLQPDAMTLWQWMGLALVVVVFGTWGDLVESHIKRQLGIKDSGNILPGHGGMLDRFDSALFAIPAAFIYLVLAYWMIG